MTTDESAPCIRDGKPSAPHGEHHVEVRGMGGRGDKAPPSAHDTVPMCRGCHREFHEGKWNFRVERGMVELLAPGDERWVIGRRGLVLSDWPVCVNCGYDETDCDCGQLLIGTSYLRLTDNGLAEAWAAADSAAVSALQQQCEIAWALKERYSHTTHKWYERAAEILSEQFKHVHWRRVYERCDLMALFGPTEEHPQGRWQDMEKLGMTVALAVAKVPADDRPAALEKALDMNADFKPALEISAAIKGDPVAEIAKVKCDCDCCDHWKGD